MIGKKILIRIEEFETNVRGVQREVEAIILDKVSVSKEIEKWNGTSDGYYGNNEVNNVVSVTKYLVEYELNNRNRIDTIYPLEIIKIL
jgi:hypothetical protein